MLPGPGGGPVAGALAPAAALLVLERHLMLDLVRWRRRPFRMRVHGI